MTSSSQARNCAASFVVALVFEGARRGLAGPFRSERQAERWALEVVGDEPGWTWAVEPVVAPASLPPARERRAARAARRRHLSIVQ